MTGQNTRLVHPNLRRKVVALKLKNADAVRAMWDAMAQDLDLAGVLIRHAHKPSDGGSRCGLSDLGQQQARAYADVVAGAIKVLDAGDTAFVSSNTERNVETLAALIAGIDEIETPAELDLPFLGEHDEDLTTCRALAARLNAKLEPGQKPFTPNSLFARLEEFGETRVGETPAASEARIRNWLLEAAKNNWVFVYSMNSPVGNRALNVGVDEALTELEVLFVGLEPEGETFTLLGRIAPEWEDVAD